MIATSPNCQHVGFEYIPSLPPMHTRPQITGGGPRILSCGPVVPMPTHVSSTPKRAPVCGIFSLIRNPPCGGDWGYT